VTIPRDEILDRNLRALLRRAYRPVLPRPIFRQALKSRLLRDFAGAAAPQLRTAPRVLLVAAAVLLSGIVTLFWLARERAGNEGERSIAVAPLTPEAERGGTRRDPDAAAIREPAVTPASDGGAAEAAPTGIAGAEAPVAVGVVTAEGVPVPRFKASLVGYSGRRGEPSYHVVARDVESPIGRFALPHDRGSSLRVFVDAEGYAVHVTDRFAPSGDPANPRAFEIALVRGGTVEGRVVDGTSGGPIAGALVFSENEVAWPLVSYHEAGMENYGGVPPRAVRTDSEGRFRLEHVAPGRPLLRAVADGRAPAWLPLAPLRDGESRTDAILEVEPGARIHGQALRDDGTPAAESVIVAMNQTLSALTYGTPVASGITRDDGRYELRDLPQGLYVVLDLGYRAHAGGDAQRMRLVFVPERGEVAIDFGPPTGELALEGSVVDAAGVPAAGVSLSLAPVGSDGSDSFAWRSSATGADGAFRFEGVSEGRYDLFRVRSGSLVERVASVGIGPPPLPALDVVLSGLGFAGRVLDGGGAPVGGAYVLLLRDDEASGEEVFAGKATSADDGRYAFRDLVPGTYRVGVAAPHADLAATYGSPRAASRDPFEDRLVLRQGGSATITLRGPLGAPVRDAHVTALRDASGADLTALVLWTSRDGTLATTGLPAGDLEIGIEAEGFAPLATRITVREGLATNAALTLRP
jgi:hypothetical protein